MAALPLLLALSVVQDWRPVVAALMLAAILAIVENVAVRWRGPVFSFLPLALMLPWTISHGETLREWGPFALTDDGVLFAGVFLLKALTLLLFVSVLLACAPLSAHVMAARRLGMPNLFAHLLTLTWRYVFVLRVEWSRLRLALRVRGFRNCMNRHARQTLGQAIGSILVRGHARAERVGQAMRCRGFNGRFHHLDESPVRTADRVMVAAGLVIAAGLIGWDVIR